jgi:Zn-dependent protease
MLYMAQAGIIVNLVLMALNLIPIPPLDGGRVLVGLLPAAGANALARLEPYGLFIILALLATGTLSGMIRPVIGLFGYLILNTLGIGGFV